MKPIPGYIYLITPANGRPFRFASAESRDQITLLLSDFAPFKIRTIPAAGEPPLLIERIPNDIRGILADKKTRRKALTAAASTSDVQCYAAMRDGTGKLGLDGMIRCPAPARTGYTTCTEHKTISLPHPFGTPEHDRWIDSQWLSDAPNATPAKRRPSTPTPKPKPANRRSGGRQ